VRKGVHSGGVPARGVQHKVYASDIWGDSIPQSKEWFALTIIELTNEIGGGSSGESRLSVSPVMDALSGLAAVGVSFEEPWIAKESSGTRRKSEEAVPNIPSSLSSRHPDSGVFCRPEERKHSVVSELSE